MDKCSKVSLQIVGSCILKRIQNLNSGMVVG